MSTINAVLDYLRINSDIKDTVLYALLEDLEQNAFEDGYRDGFADGFADGRVPDNA